MMVKSKTMRVAGCILTGMVAVTLTQCAGLKLHERQTPVVKLAKPQGRQAAARGASAQAYSEAYRLILEARKKEKRFPGDALRIYVKAARIAYQSRYDELLPLYNHATGQVADLAVQGEYQPGRSPVAIHAPRILASGKIDDILPADCLKTRGWRTVVNRPGVGASVVVRRVKDHVRGIDKPYALPVGHSIAATVVLEFPAGKRPILRFHDPVLRESVTFWGKSRKLAYDLTMPLAVLFEHSTPSWQDAALRWTGVFSPMKHVGKMHLYMTEPFDPNKIPLVLVHGLISDPSIWHNVMNEIRKDPEIRKSYQILAFYYPTGLPLRVPSAALKREINQLYAHYSKAGKGSIGRQMVIAGHSLGGLLTSVQVRQMGKDLMHKVLQTPEDLKRLNPEVVKDFRYLMDGPKPHFVKRVVFIATPHRGSRSADIYPVRVLTSFVKIPQNLLFLDTQGTSGALTDFGKSLLGSGKKENSLTLLRSHSTTLTVLTNSPFMKHVTYHSIMGDRGRGGTPADSSDGVVSYRSSHLEGARSEVIVPSGHDAYDHPEAIRELVRILRLHIRK